MLVRFGLIVLISICIAVSGAKQCCTGFLREYDHSESCSLESGGKCYADNVIYSEKHQQLIGSESARLITEGDWRLCQQCFVFTMKVNP